MFKNYCLGVMITLISVCAAPAALAQVLTVDNNSRIVADISSTQVTRIAVANDRISRLRGAANAYVASNDDAQGAVFIKPVILPKTCHPQPSNKKNRPKKCLPPAKATKPFYLFIDTEQNRHYVLWLTPKKDSSADMLILKPQEAEMAAAKAWEESGVYAHTLLRLVTAIIQNQIPPGYTLADLKKEGDFTAGDSLRLHLVQSYLGAHLQADVYQIRNRSHHPIVLAEQDLSQLGDRAIYLQEQRLLPGQSTQLIKVSRHV